MDAPPWLAVLVPGAPAVMEQEAGTGKGQGLADRLWRPSLGERLRRRRGGVDPIGGRPGGVPDPVAALRSTPSPDSGSFTATVYVTVTDPPAASEPFHVSTEPANDAVPLVAVIDPSSNVASSSTSDSSSVIAPGSSTTAPVFVAISV